MAESDGYKEEVWEEKDKYLSSVVDKLNQICISEQLNKVCGNITKVKRHFHTDLVHCEAHYSYSVFIRGG